MPSNLENPNTCLNHHQLNPNGLAAPAEFPGVFWGAGFAADAGLTGVTFLAELACFIAPLVLFTVSPGFFLIAPLGLFAVSPGFFLIAPGLGVVVFAADCTGFGAPETAFLVGAVVAEEGFFAAPAGAGKAFFGVAAVLFVVIKAFEGVDVVDAGARYICPLVTCRFPPVFPALNPKGLLAVAARNPSADVQSMRPLP